MRRGLQKLVQGLRLCKVSLNKRQSGYPLDNAKHMETSGVSVELRRSRPNKAVTSELRPIFVEDLDKACLMLTNLVLEILAR
jgi:hypothetical protein